MVVFQRELLILATTAQSLLRCSGGIAYPRSGDLIWLAFVGGASLFASAFFRSSIGYPVVDACTKVMVGGVVTLQLDPFDGKVNYVNYSV
ncbi:hypothetical protein B296_00031566 [Ensete ventricosum]|uniref:Uncharacterized protein n=1 Tax=Ensete ventricosum TaxID=4639 RepID=A0A426YJB1_ENSVE|nr:hypothetical protein B296_00031566 [Ensete ventricosum]